MRKFVLYLFLVHLGIVYGLNVNAQSNDSIRILPIPLSEIASTAANDLQSTRDLLENRIQRSNPTIIPQLDTLLIQVSELKDISDQILEANSRFAYYNSLIQRWERILSEIEPVHSNLKEYSTEMEGIRDLLQARQEKWDITLQETDPVPADDVISRILTTKSFMDSTTQILSDSLNVSIALQNRITDLQIISETYLQNIEDMQKVVLGEALLKRGNPIFRLKAGGDTLHYEEDKATLLVMGIEDTKVYLENEWPTLLLLSMSFLGLLIAFIYLKKVYAPVESGEDPNEKNRAKVLSKPVLTASIFTMLLAVWWLPDRPLFLREIFSFLLIIPFLPIFFGIVFKQIRFSLYFLFALFIFNVLNDYLQMGLVYDRFSSLLESIALFSFHVYFLLAKKRLKKDSVKGSLFYQFLKSIQPFYFLLTLSAIIANLIGFRNYAELINEAVVSSLIILMLFATGYFSLISLLHVFFHTKIADKSLILSEEKESIYKWLFRYLRYGTIYLWIYFTLKLFYLWGPLTEGVRKVLDLGYHTDTANLSIGSILNFILVIYLSWLMSYIIRNLLEVELFGRFNVPRGVPKAVSSLTQYFLISAGFLLALSVAGFSMQNLSLLAGALGVGIGFGLQNIVNNFISGLILAFERPVTVGDIIDVSGHEGKVQRIGIRASVIKQYDGSEVIVPNAELISSKVVNWTLSKYTRRLILTIHTHKDTDIDKVLKLMKDAVSKVEFVLKKPEVKSYFHGIKDKELEFALYYWASGNILDCKSLVNQEVQKALVQENIEFVMPLHVVMQKEEDK